MKTMRGLVSSVLIFGAAALVGPLIGWLIWPPYRFEHGQSTPVGDFVRDLVFLIWPTGPLGVIEVNTGPSVAAVSTIGANVLLFVLVGAAVGAAVRHRFWLRGLYLVVCVLVLLFALWGVGYSFAYLNGFALAASWLYYAIPFWFVVRVAQEEK